MGRSAFKLIIERLNLQNSQMLFPAYICDIFYPIFKQYQIYPIFLEPDKETFKISLEQISKKITPGTKSILVNHTYGSPANIEKIRDIVGKEVVIIEDCAHSFGIAPSESSEAAFFSLYKSFPSCRGGLAILPKNKNNRPVLHQVKHKMPKTSFGLRDFISLLNSFSLFAYLFKRFGGEIAPLIPRKEKLTEPSQLNRVSLNLFLKFLEKFQETLPHRIELALHFQEELQKLDFEVQESQNNVFTYLSALVPSNLKDKRDKLVRELHNYGVFCTRIWHTPIVLNPMVQKEYNLNLADFPITTDIAKRVINFPLQNFYTRRDISNMVGILKKSLRILL